MHALLHILQALVHLAPLPAGGLGAADVDVPAAFQQLEQQQQHQRLDFLGPNLPQELAQGIAEGEVIGTLSSNAAGSPRNSACCLDLLGLHHCGHLLATCSA